MSTDENVVAENWEDADNAVKAMEKRFEQVKILQRKQEALIEKSKSEKSESDSSVVKNDYDCSLTDGAGPSNEEPKKILLKRPKENRLIKFEDSTTTTKTTTTQSTDSLLDKPIESETVDRGRKASNVKSKVVLKTFEERQAAYQEARDRILGTEYKPTSGEIKEITVVERSKSPETITIPRVVSSHHFQNNQMQPSIMSFVIPPPGFQHMPPPNINLPNGFIPPPQFSLPPPPPSLQSTTSSNLSNSQQFYEYSPNPQQKNYQTNQQFYRMQNGSNQQSFSQVAGKKFQQSSSQKQKKQNFQPMNVPPPSFVVPPVPPPPTSSSSNPIPFGCPPMSVNKYANQNTVMIPQSFTIPPPPIPKNVENRKQLDSTAGI